MKIQTITDELIKIHTKYSFERHSNNSSQMCRMWSVDDPPDTLEYTDPLEDICKI